MSIFSFSWASFKKCFILVTMIHGCKQNLPKITVVYLFPMSETMLLSIRIQLRTTNKRVMSINLFYFSSCVSFSNQLRTEESCAAHQSITVTQPIVCLISRSSYYTTTRKKPEDTMLLCMLSPKPCLYKNLSLYIPKSSHRRKTVYLGILHFPQIRMECWTYVWNSSDAQGFLLPT